MTETAEVVTAGNVARPPWRRLLVATPIGWALGIAAGVGLIVLAESLGLRELQSPLVLGVALGVSMQQVRALASLLEGSGRRRWVLGSCLGLASPFIVADIALTAGHPMPYNLTVFVILGGVVASLLQWGVLKTTVRQSGGWLAASPAGYLAAAGTVWLNEQVLPKTPGLPGALQYLAVVLAGGVLLGVFTAMAAYRFSARSTRLSYEDREGYFNHE